MVRASAAVAPSSHEITEEDPTPRPQHEFTSLVSVQSEASTLTKPKSGRKHRRHHSLFSSTSIDSPDNRPTPGMAPSTSNGVAGLRKTLSGKLSRDWKLGELWYTRTQGKENVIAAESVAESSSATNASAEDQSKSASAIVVGSSNAIDQSTRVPIKQTRSLKPHREWRIGDFWHTRRHESEKRAVTTTSNSTGINNKTSKTSEQTESSSSSSYVVVASTAVTEIATISTMDASTADHADHSLHFTSLGVFTSSKFSGSDLEVSDHSHGGSPPDRSVEVTKTAAPLATLWREIQGASNWEGLLDPLDLDLRKEILRYGEFAQMTYDNFEDDRRSKYAGSARFPKQKLFENLHKREAGYQVTRYLYATCENPLPGILQSSISSERWDVESNWMGFVAVATDAKEIARLGRRDIVVSWRGTMRTIEWLVDAQIQMAPMTIAPDPQGGSTAKPVEMRPKVEKGFWSLYTCKRPASQFNKKSASEQVIQELTRLLALYKGEELSITLTGHSLGGALAILTAYEVAEKGLNKETSTSAAGTHIETTIPVTVFTFGSPRVGDAVFRKRFEELQLKALRVVNVHDLVPKSIGGFHPPWGETYKHVGAEIQVNHKLSTYMKHTRDPLDWHNLECYLHHVDGYQGPKSKDFKLVTGRDHALINKAADVLKQEYCVPSYWWQVENKGLVLSADGRWVEPDRAMEDTPSLENRDRFI